MHFILSITLIHLLACLSPGPDIFLVIRTSLRHGWRIAASTTAGILTGVCLMITFGLTGITYLISQQASMVQILTLAGGAWLIYLGSGILRLGRAKPAAKDGEPEIAMPALSVKSAWLEGLIVNLSNPKAMLYFLSLFSVMLGPEVPLRTKVLAACCMVIAQAAAFVLAAILIAHPAFRKRWPSLQQWLDWTISLVLFGLGLWIWIRFALSLMA